MNEKSLIRGNILQSLISFALPVLAALFLQAMYGTADLIIVGRFASTAEQSGVASGSQLFNMITMMITGLSMGITVFVGNAIGLGKKEEAGKGVGNGIAVFAVVAAAVTLVVVPFADRLAAFMHPPPKRPFPGPPPISVFAASVPFLLRRTTFSEPFFAVSAIPKRRL